MHCILYVSMSCPKDPQKALEILYGLVIFYRPVEVCPGHYSSESELHYIS